MNAPAQRTATAASLSGAFRDFYQRTRTCRARLAAADTTLEAARQPLVDALAALEPGNEDRLATDSESLAEARYLMACYADDSLGTGGEPWARGWREAGLEQRLYRTTEGGSRVFERIDKLLEIGDPGRRELAAVYLLALSLGFRGRFGEGSGDRQLRALSRRLLALAAPERRDADSARWVTPAAYRHTLSRADAKLLPDLRLWGWTAAGTVLVLLLVSFLIYGEETATIAALVERLIGRGGAG